MPEQDVFPVESSKRACASSTAAGDIGRQIAVFYQPEDAWYCGTVESWRPSSDLLSESTVGLGVHSVKFEVNDEMEDIVLDENQIVWMSNPMATKRHKLKPAFYVPDSSTKWNFLCK